MADLTQCGNKEGKGSKLDPEESFGYIAFCHDKKITLKELSERLRAITEMSCGMAAVMAKVIACPDMDSETAGIARLIHAGASEILEQASHLGPREEERIITMRKDAA